MEEQLKPFHEIHMVWLKSEQSSFDAWKNYQELKERAEKNKQRWQDTYNKMTDEERRQYATL